MAGPKLDGQMLPPPIYLHKSSRKVASIRCAGTLRGLKACSPPAIPEEESYPEHIEEYPLPPAYLPKWRHWHMAHQMGKSAVNKSRLAAIILCLPHHPCAGNWERYSLYRKKAGPELFFLASSSKELISLNRKSTRALEAGLAWALEPGANVKSIHEDLLNKRIR